MIEVFDTNVTDRWNVPWAPTVREFIQNAIDWLATQKAEYNGLPVKAADGKLLFNIETPSSDVLYIIQAPTKLSRVALSFASSKGHGSAGGFGEGLVANVLVIVKAGYDVKFTMTGEVWDFFLDRARPKRMDEGVVAFPLKVRITPTTHDGNFIICVNGRGAGDLFNPNDYIFSSKKRSSVLVDQQRMFAFGIYVTEYEECLFGYNLYNVYLDRDRNSFRGGIPATKIREVLNRGVRKGKPGVIDKIIEVLKSESLKEIPRDLKMLDQNNIEKIWKVMIEAMPECGDGKEYKPCKKETAHLPSTVKLYGVLNLVPVPFPSVVAEFLLQGWDLEEAVESAISEARQVQDGVTDYIQRRFAVVSKFASTNGHYYTVLRFVCGIEFDTVVEKDNVIYVSGHRLQAIEDELKFDDPVKSPGEAMLKDLAMDVVHHMLTYKSNAHIVSFHIINKLMNDEYKLPEGEIGVKSLLGSVAKADSKAESKAGSKAEAKCGKKRKLAEFGTFRKYEAAGLKAVKLNSSSSSSSSSVAIHDGGMQNAAAEECNYSADLVKINLGRHASIWVEEKHADEPIPQELETEALTLLFRTHEMVCTTFMVFFESLGQSAPEFKVAYLPHAEKIVAYWSPRDGSVVLNLYLCRGVSNEELYKTLSHEIAHMMTPGAGHSMVWVRAVQSVMTKAPFVRR